MVGLALVGNLGGATNFVRGGVPGAMRGTDGSDPELEPELEAPPRRAMGGGPEPGPRRGMGGGREAGGSFGLALLVSKSSMFWCPHMVA